MATGALVLGTATGVLLGRGARPSAASPTLLQTTAVGRSLSAQVTLSFASSTAGSLLIATVSGFGATDPFTAPPAGWTDAAETYSDQNPHAAVYYMENTLGGAVSATFKGPSYGFMAGQMTEWSGMASATPVDAVLNNNPISGSNTTSITESPSGSTHDTDELAVAVYSETQAASSTDAFTPGSGWTQIGSTGALSANTKQYVADYTKPLAIGTASETETASHAGTWTAAIVTFKDACTGGSRAVTPPGTITFSGVTLTGLDQTSSSSPQITASDMTGGGAGWNVQLTSTQFRGSGHTLPTTATTATGASVSAGPGNCTLPTNSITYPVSVPAGPGPPTAVKVYNAAANTGGGPSLVTLTFSLAVPGLTIAATYTSTWTVTIASGP